MTNSQNLGTDRRNQSCTGSCPFEGGNRNVTGN